jgi:phytoene synthase
MVTDIAKFPVRLFYPLYERTQFHRAVIEELVDEELKSAYKHCRSVTKVHAKTFYLATRFLPYHKQRGIFALYALCRYLDDLVDEAEDLLLQEQLSLSDIEQKIEEWRVNINSVFDGQHINHPVLLAIRDTLKHFSIDAKYPLELLEGVSSDLVKNRYANFDELYKYSYQVASVVGLMTTDVFGFSGEKAKLHAEHLGIAMQLTNILRDVGEDLDRNRIYIPQEDLLRFNVTEEDLFARKITPEFKALMSFQIERARYYYRSAALGIPMLSKDSRLPVALALQNYSKILDEIESLNYGILTKRAYLNFSQKMINLPKAWLLAKSS